MKERIFGTAVPVFLSVAVALLCRFALPAETKIAEILSSQISVLKIPRIKILYKEMKEPSDVIPVECRRVVPVTYTRVVSLESLPPEERKRLFIDMVLPSILIANHEVKFTRENLLRIRIP